MCHNRAPTTYRLATIHALQTDRRQTDDTSYPKLDLTVGQEDVRLVLEGSKHSETGNYNH